MNPLLRRLATLRLKVRMLEGWQGVCAMAALVLGVGVAVGWADYYLHLPSLVRAMALVGLLVGAGLVAYYYLVQPFSRSCDDLSLALRLEEAYPELNDSLASTVQFLTLSKADLSRIGASDAMRDQTVKQALERAASFDFSRILDRRAAAIFGAAAICVAALACAVLWTQPVYSGIALKRFVEPFGGHTWTTIAVERQAPLDLLGQGEDWEPLDPAKPKDRVAIGRPYLIRVWLTGQIPKNARIEMDGHIRTDKTIELKEVGPHSATFIAPIDMTQQYRPFKFRVLANDGIFPARGWFDVEVLPPPRLIDLDGLPSPQITIHPPAYTDVPARKLDPGNRHIDVFAGTRVVLRAKADRPLAQAWIEYRPDNALVTTAATLSLFGQTSPLDAVVLAAAGNSIWGRIPADFDAKDRSVFSINFVPSVSGAYTLHLRDHDRLERVEAADLKVNLDPLPSVRLLAPSASVTAIPTANVGFKFVVTDPLFAIKTVYIEYQRKNPDGTPIDDKQRVVLYEAKDFGKLIPRQFARLGNSWVAAPDLRLRPQKLEFDTVWALKNEFKSGEIVTVEVCAVDFCDLYPEREAGRSHAISMRIISKQELLTEADRRLTELHEKIKQVEAIEHKAQDAVKEIRKEDKIDRIAMENFIDKGVQQQREVQERVGKTSFEGLRRDVNEIRQTLKDNGLTGTSAYRQTGKIKGTLDAIAQQELPQIEPRLNEASTEMVQGEKNTPKSKSTLGEADKLQQSVRDALNDLLRETSPSAKMSGFKNDIRDIMEKQEEIRQSLERLNNRKEELQNAELGPKERKIAEEAQQQEITEKVKEQRDLANKLEKLIGQMKTAKTEFDKAGDKANAQKLQDAINHAEGKKPEMQEEKKDPKNDKKEPKIDKKDPPKQSEPIAGQMKNVADELQNKDAAPQKTLTKQEKIQQNLEQMLKNLEGRPEESTKQDIQDRKDAQAKLDQLNKKLQQLREEIKKADKIENMEERLKKKEELAKMHEQLQQEMAEMRRQLARLNETRAANDLQKAAEDLEKAHKQMQEGGNPDADLQKAQNEINRAKEELKQAQDELARELLIKLADQLEGLKMRQVAQIERSDQLQGKVMKRKQWTESLLDAIEGNIEGQKTIAEETDTFKDKLKGAVVFHDILKKAKGSMDEAGGVMTERFDAAKDAERRDKKLDEDQLKEEVDWHAGTVRHQKMAADRLERLLDALKEEINKKKKPPEVAQDQNPPERPPEEEQGGMQAQDGIPPTAQLKALKAEQLDLNKRTEDFAKRHPNLNDLKQPAQDELRQLFEEQQSLQELFNRLLPPAQPERKEGAGQ